VRRTNDPELVRAEYADESRFAVRAAAWANATGPSPRWGLFRGSTHRTHAFSVENGAEQLARHFARVERRDANGTMTFPDWEAARTYVSASVTRRDLAGRLPRFESPLVCSRIVSVFVAETAP
jgi:hypothetical protein